MEPSAVEDFNSWSTSGANSATTVVAVHIAAVVVTEDSIENPETLPLGVEVHAKRILILQIDIFWDGLICLYSDPCEAVSEKDRCQTNDIYSYILYDPDKPTFDRTPLQMKPYLSQLQRSDALLEAIPQLPPELVFHIVRECCLENDVRHMTYAAWQRLEWESRMLSIIVMRPTLHSDMWYLGTQINRELRNEHQNCRIQFYTWDVEHPASRCDLWHIYDRFHRNNPKVSFLFFAEPEVSGARYLGLVEQYEDGARWVRKVHFSQLAHIWIAAHDEDREGYNSDAQVFLDMHDGASEQEDCIELLLNYDDPLPHLPDTPATSTLHTDPIETNGLT